MMLGKRLLACLLLCLLFVSGTGRVLAGDLVAVPPFTGPLVDQAGLLQAEQAAQLDRRLRQFAQAHGSQIAVLIVQTTHPESIEEYSIRVFDAWKIGRKQIDDGILILVAARAHKLRIDTGYGLEGVIPDAIAKRIIRENMVPKFRAGDAHAGLLAGIEQIEKLIEGEHLPPPKQGTQGGGGGQKSDGQFSEMLVVGIIAASVLGGVLCMIFGRFFGSLATGGLVGTIAWFMSGSLVVLFVAAFIVFLFVLMTGGGGSLWGGGFGGGGDSWSGGGGGAGGGGASGDW